VLLFEFEGKRFLREHGVPIPRGVVVESAREVPGALADLPGPWMVKAQVLAGGRGKSGGILPAETVAEAEAVAGKLLGSTLAGHPVQRLLVEERLFVKAEYYAAVLVDGADVLVLLGTRGGIDIETFYAEQAGSVEVVRIDPLYGLQAYQVRAALDRLGVRPEAWGSFTEVVTRLATLLFALDATLVEVNPLAETADGRLAALDARVEVDDGALYRQPRLREIHAGRLPESPVLRTMRELDIQYVPMGGNVGLLSSGAGAGVAILDWIDQEAGRPAGFVDIDYALLSGKAEAAIRTTLGLFAEDGQVRSVLVNFTTCGIRVDGVATTLVRVLREMGARLGKPCFIHLQGNRGEEAHAVIRQAGYRLCETLSEAVREACRAAADGKRT
jgi:succinyl-CoA synthetase beta subunit